MFRSIPCVQLHVGRFISFPARRIYSVRHQLISQLRFPVSILVCTVAPSKAIFPDAIDCLSPRSRHYVEYKERARQYIKILSNAEESVSDSNSRPPTMAEIMNASLELPKLVGRDDTIFLLRTYRLYFKTKSSDTIAVCRPE